MLFNHKIVMTQLNCPKRYAYPNSQVNMAELGECKSSQDRKIQGTHTERSVRTNDVTSSDNVKVIDIRTKVSVCMSDELCDNFKHCPGQRQQSCSTGIKSAQKNASVPSVECSLHFSVRREHAKRPGEK